MLVHRRVTPSIKFAGTHLYTWVERGTVRVKCLAYEHNAMSLARSRTRTARSGAERTKKINGTLHDVVISRMMILSCMTDRSHKVGKSLRASQKQPCFTLCRIISVLSDTILPFSRCISRNYFQKHSRINFHIKLHLILFLAFWTCFYLFFTRVKTWLLPSRRVWIAKWIKKQKIKN